MDTKELLDNLHKLTIDDTDGPGELQSDKDGQIIINALLRHLPEDVLKEIQWPDWGGMMIRKAKNFIKSRNRALSVNHPVDLLLKWYCECGSGKRRLAMSEFRRRFDYLCPDEQKEIILTVFKNGPITDCIWAAKKSKLRWNPEYATDLARVWLQVDLHNRCIADLSKAVLENLSPDFIIQHKWRLAKVLGYHLVCIKLGNKIGFEIEWERMYFPEQLYVKAQLGIAVDHHETELKIYRYLYENVSVSRPYDPYSVGINNDPLLFNVAGMEHIVWAMGKLGMHEALFRLFRFSQLVKNEPLCYCRENMASIVREKIMQYGLMGNILVLNDYKKLL